MARDPLRGAWLARALPSVRVDVFPRLRSTNTFAAAQIESGALNAPALIAASLQTAGRGQHTNTWWSDAGSACATFVLPAIDGMPIGQVPLRAGLAVALVIERLLPRATVQVKWPNDVLVDGCKIAGLLCRRIRGADLVGIGLNVTTGLRRAPPDVRARATTLARHIRRPPRRDEILRDLWRTVAETRTRADWRESFAHRHQLEGRHVEMAGGAEAPLRGIVRGVDDDGRLLVEVNGMLMALTGGTPRTR